MCVLKEVPTSSSLPSKLTPCCDTTRSLGCPWWLLQAPQPPWQCCRPGELPAAHSIHLCPAQPDPDSGHTPLHPVAPTCIRPETWAYMCEIVILYLLFNKREHSQLIFGPPIALLIVFIHLDRLWRSAAVPKVKTVLAEGCGLPLNLANFIVISVSLWVVKW